MSLLTFQDKLGRLNVNASGGRSSPHKICMLLAVLDLARGGGLTENRITFDAPLLERYSRFFEAVRTPTDHPNPYFPFFHLAGKLRGGSPGFWHLHAIPGKELVLSNMTTARSYRDVTDNIAYASLDPELYALLGSAENIDALGQAMALRWFDRGLSDLHAAVSRCYEISVYEYKLRSAPALLAKEAVPPVYVRDPAFRRVVTQMYDYRCAATGVRLLLPNGEALVEAAHIHPFHEAGDDDPRNGLALTPDMHWAFDRNLIALGPDLKWHVSRVLDARVRDFSSFVALEGKPLLGPVEARMLPKQEVLQWRIDRLRESAAG